MLNRRALVFLALAIVFGVGAALATRSYIEGKTAPSAVEPIETVSVATAARNIAIGSALSESDLRTVEWPESLALEDTFRDVSDLEGRVLRRAMAAGEPVLESALLPAGSAAGLTAVIAESHRAVSVKVDAVVGVAGFVKPGARVDVLATLRRANASNFSNVILQDVRVLAVDQTMEQVNDGDPKVVNVATLEVKPDEAERLIHAAHEGRLQLALRHPGDGAVVATRAVGASDLYGAPRAAGKANGAKRGPAVQVIKGTSVTHSRY